MTPNATTNAVTRTCVITGGTEAAIHPLPMAAFANMMALSKRNDEPERASRPYDKGRDGFVLGEGAGLVVLESAEHAQARDARVYAELAGAGMSADSHHIAQPDPSGAGAVKAMRFALADADLDTSDVTHLNAHATSTPAGDLAEAIAIRTAFGDDTGQVAVTSTKSMTGHLLGGAGAVESIAAILALHHRVAPPTINVDDLDDEVDLDVISGQQRALGDGPLAAWRFGACDDGNQPSSRSPCREARARGRSAKPEPPVDLLLRPGFGHALEPG